MNLLRWILTLPIIIGAVLFAVSNPEIVGVTWHPNKEAFDVPLYLVAFVFLGAGFLIGAIMTWFAYGSVRREKRQQKKTIRKLEKDINEANEKMMETLAKVKPEKQHLAANDIIEADNE